MVESPAVYLLNCSADLYFSWTIPSKVLHCLHETKYPVTSLGSFNSSVSYPVAVISAPHFVQLAIILSNESKDIQYQSFLSEILTNAHLLVHLISYCTHF